ncbi:peroxisomal multifunctional enzyme type 2-like [Tigriopus californicus]|uniref:peroxisomal multifunctional enzyme type 2-like n=1 Tax=Tigriopus californicus TaxID=6832 RepID=UPI0027DA3497|nr:peroxisomal multifunctional enzyme type 2-like [Tigriopus californicus]
MALMQPRPQALRAWLARPVPTSSAHPPGAGPPTSTTRTLHAVGARDAHGWVSLWRLDEAGRPAPEWTGVNRQRRDWLRFGRRGAHTRTSSGSKGGRVLDTILYHLAVGKTLGLSGSNAIQYLNENDEGFRVLPLFGTIPAQKGIKEILEEDLQIDFSKLLHGEHYFQLYRPIPKGAQVHSIIQLADIVNKGKDAVFIFDVATRDDQENFLMYNQFCYFVKGAGGIGVKTCSDSAVPIINNYFQDQHPTFEHHHTTSADQAALFRLTGDTNPYLIDPNLAQKFGYKHPPLHGVCSIGIVANILQEQFQIPDDKFKGIKVRFSAPLFPGDTIQIWAWRMHKNVIFFNTMSMETGEMVHTGGYVTTY